MFAQALAAAYVVCMNNAITIPTRFVPAYAWTRAANEVATLAMLDGADLDAYCDESEQNAIENGIDDVTSGDLFGLALWLRATGR